MKDGQGKLSGFDRLDRGIVNVVRCCSYISGAIIFIIAVLATVNIVTSKVFLWSVPSATEWVTYLFMGVVYCSCAYAQLGTGLVSVDIISQKYSPAVKNVTNILFDLVGIGVFYLICRNAWPLLTYNIRYKVMSSTGQGAFPLWPFNLLLMFFTGVMALAFAWSIVRIIVGWRRASAQGEGEAKA